MSAEDLTSDDKNSKFKKFLRLLTKRNPKGFFHRHGKAKNRDSAQEDGDNDTNSHVESSLFAEAALARARVENPARRWLNSLHRSDPRWQLMRYFCNELSRDCNNMSGSDERATMLPFSKTSVFTVWRPTSFVAIRRMIAGEATGKGLEIKGKSAKAGKLSGYVPFLQIHEEEDKSKVRTIPRGGRVRVFYATKEVRDAVMAELEPFQDEMLNAVHDAKRIVIKTALSGLSSIDHIGQSIVQKGKETAAVTTSVRKAALAEAVLSRFKTFGRAAKDTTTSSLEKSGSELSKKGKQASAAVSLVGTTIGADAVVSRLRKSARKMSVKGLGIPSRQNKEDDEDEWAFKRLLWDMDDPSIKIVDTYAPQRYGIEMPDRLLWQAFVVVRDISRPEGSEFYTARPSEPAFQDMNWISIYKTRKNQTSSKKACADEPRVVLCHTCGSEEDPMDPRGLIMAYEENGRVIPVVSDFDCFTMGTQGLNYDTPLPKDQVELLQWCLLQIEGVLDKQDSSSKSLNWTRRWLEVLKSSAIKGFHPIVPRFGFGDKTSYEIIENAVSWLKGNGAVRHGPECFNYYFPQELDSEFLIVSDSLPGKISWQYVGVKELQDFLLQKIDEGFTFPLNPKWVLCDEGWKVIYDRLMSSNRPDVQDSLDIWFPLDSGVRERIETVCSHHPSGFVCLKQDDAVCMDGTEAMDLATLELDRYLALQRAKMKLRVVMSFNQLLHSVRRKNAENREAVAASEGNDIDDDT